MRPTPRMVAMVMWTGTGSPKLFSQIRASSTVTTAASPIHFIVCL